MFLEVKAKPLGLLNCILFYPTDDIRNIDNAELAGKLNSYTNEKVKQNQRRNDEEVGRNCGRFGNLGL
jgi:hypothetical protein